MMVRLGELFAEPDRTRRLGIAALGVLLAEPSVDAGRIAANEFCFGATVALETARTGADVKAVVGFHPGLRNVRPHDTVNIGGRVMFVGADDPMVPLGHRQGFEAEMRDAGVDWQLHLYGGVQHSFTHPGATAAGTPGIAYDARAAAHSWAALLAVFDDVLAAQSPQT